jgi:TolB-like protein
MGVLNNKNMSFAVGDWLVQPHIDQISTAAERQYLRPQLMDVLVYLANLQGQVATLETIHEDLWSGKVVSSGTIYNCIAELRQALAKDNKNLTYIETIPKKGYRLAAPVVALLADTVHSSSHGASVAILPLLNRSEDADAEHLCEGIAEEIIYLLSKVNCLKVFSAFTLKDEMLDPRVVGLRFSAQTVLTGSLKKSAEKLRLSFRLDDVSSGETLWSDRYDQHLSDVFELQDTVARQVVSAVSTAFDIESGEASLLENSGTCSLEAFNAFLLGKHSLSKSTSQSYDDAIGHFEQAIEIDPSFARAHYRLYLTSYMKRRLHRAGDEYLEKARAAASNAKKHGYKPALPWIHIHRRLHRNIRPDHRELALEALEKIRKYDPEWGCFGYEQLTWILPAAGFFQATLDFANRMFDSPTHNFEDSDVDEELPHYYAAVGQLEMSIQLWSGAIQKDPIRPLFRFNRSLLYTRTGQIDYAEGDIATLDAGTYRDISKAFYWFWRDQPDRIMAYHQRLRDNPETHPSLLLYTCCMLGDFDSAIVEYEKSVNSQSRSYVDFGPLRSTCRARLPLDMVNRLERHPGFQRLLEQEGVDEAWRRELMERVNDLFDITGIQIREEENES